MKKLFVLVAILFLVASSAYAINVKETVEEFNPGASTTDKEEVIATVYNATSAALANGDVLVYNTTSDDGRSVTKCNGLGQRVAGVATETIAAGAWGKMIVYGYHSAVKFRGAVGYDVTAGYPLYPYGTLNGSNETTNTYDGYAGGGLLVGGAYKCTAFGVALDTGTGGTSTTVEAFIDCL